MSVSESKPTSPQRFRWCRFSCRTLLVLVAVIAVCLGVGMRPWKRHQTLEMIRCELQGGVYYGYQYHRDESGRSAITDTEPGPGPKWLRRCMGEILFDDVFCDVSAIDIGYYPIHLGRPNPPKDELCPIEDSHLKRLREVLPMFDHLQVLGVTASSKVTDSGLEHLAGIPQLQDLDVAESRVTSVGLRHIATATSLIRLDLRKTSLGDDLACLSSFQQLEILDLGQTTVTDDGLRYLAALPNLQRLALDGPKITDAGLRHLRGMKSLTLLILTDTQVCKASISPPVSASFGVTEHGGCCQFSSSSSDN